MNHAANARYALEALNDGHLDMPVLFLEAEYDYTCDCVNSPLTEPMKKLCRDLTIERISSGHWMAQEKPVEVNASLAQWLGAKVPQAWLGQGPGRPRAVAKLAHQENGFPVAAGYR